MKKDEKMPLGDSVESSSVGERKEIGDEVGEDLRLDAGGQKAVKMHPYRSSRRTSGKK